MSTVFTLSDVLGYTSIGCWLGAQFPQVVENWRRKSCEGLALPFLANWLLGDISNLIGCILTNQLPFQKYLAIYFVFVDVSLVAQYFYYDKLTPKTPHFGHPRLASTPATGIRPSVERGASRYRTLSTVAANVAAAAALAAQQVEAHGPPPGSARSLRPMTSSGALDDTATVTSPRQLEDEDTDEETDAARALVDSFHSEGGRRLGRKRVTYSIERQGRPTRESSVYPPLSGGLLSSEPLTLRTSIEPADDEGERLHTGRRHSRARSRGHAGMVFLGAWALFGIGTMANNGRGVMTTPSTSVGRLLVPHDFFAPYLKPSIGDHNIPVANAEPLPELDVRAEEMQFEVSPSVESTSKHHSDPPEEPEFEQVIGRIFAWLCTTLYLTSRLPQIWKNFVRKSVEGLSMYLFVFAFMGNMFYVASILVSPKMSLPPAEAAQFLRETTPYLLGSAGTLMFDMTIVTQSFLYRPKPRRHLTRSRLSLSEEEAGLLSGDGLHESGHLSHPDSPIMNRGRASRTRSVGPS